jgi:hypothetical protein
LARHADAIVDHYTSCWQSAQSLARWSAGPIHDLPDDFRVAIFAPGKRRNAWTYATVGMSQPGDANPIELHLLSPVETRSHVELLTAIAHYHRTGAALGVGHTVNFGRPWLPLSKCDYGLISLPYLDGPALENVTVDDMDVRCLWLIPIGSEERRFAKDKGTEALEERFESTQFDYLDPARPSVV